MQEVFEKIKERVCEFIHERNKSGSAPCKNQRASCLQLIRVCDLTAIVNQVAEEYNQSLANNNQSLTNADKIRSMSNEELAKFLLKVNTAYAEPCMTGETDCKWEDYPDHSRGCKDCFEEWLQQVTGKLKGEQP